jgi:carbamoyltransferase
VIVLGISGGFDLVHQKREYLIADGNCHDSAAVLVEDGQVVAAIEEERLNRIKHTNKAPVRAIDFCLASRGIQLKDVDAVAFYGSEENCAKILNGIYYSNPDASPTLSVRELIHAYLRDGLGQEIEDRKLTFVNHHLSHAASAFLQSGFDDAMVLTLDGAGDFLSGSVSSWKDGKYQLLRSLPVSHSLGFLYDAVIAILGYRVTEEYKVMGLAPYGNPARFRTTFEDLYELLPQGEYVIRWERMEQFHALMPPRKRGDPMLDIHKDLAAGLQQMLERIAFHVIRHFQALTHSKSLCFAGGVAHNSTLNGKILCSGLFERIFVQPASHDAGCALGAALYAGSVLSTPKHSAIHHVYWGTDVPCKQRMRQELETWSSVLDFEEAENVALHGAELIAGGRVIGWVQGRSEFGPRALGNRSILADPRPANNREIVNRLIKKREGYRPFAPSVLEEMVNEYFEAPRESKQFPFMSFTLQVRPDKRDLLGATTHIDGSARVQTVSKESNPLFWKLIDAFREITGVGVVLNTSFNNNVEPIVDSVEDAIACFMTTELHYLVIGDFIVKKKPGATRLIDLKASLPTYSKLMQSKVTGANGQWQVQHSIGTTFGATEATISAEIYSILSTDGGCSIAQVLGRDSTIDRSEIAHELQHLWSLRVIRLSPPS